MIIDFSNNGNGGGSYELPIASQSTLGGIKVGENLSIDSAGTLSADAQAVGVATTATTGVVQVGSGLSITSGGVLSTDIDLSDYVQTSELENYATKTDLSGYALESELGDYATIESLSGYVETSEMSGYVTTNTLSGYATTDSLSGYVETSAMSGYVETSALTDYATNESLSAYQTTQGMSGYVQTSAMSGYATTDSLSAYTPQSAMSDYLTTSEYRDDVDDVLEQNMKTLYGDDDAVGMAYLWNDGVSDKAKVFKVTASGTSVDDYTYVQPSKNTKAFVGWSMDKSEQIATIDETNWDNPTIATKSDVAKFGYVDEENGVAHFLVSYNEQLMQQTWTKEYDQETGEEVWNDGGVQPIGGDVYDLTISDDYAYHKNNSYSEGVIGYIVGYESGIIYGEDSPFEQSGNTVYYYALNDFSVQFSLNSIGEEGFAHAFVFNYSYEDKTLTFTNLNDDEITLSYGNNAVFASYGNTNLCVYFEDDHIYFCKAANNRAPVQLLDVDGGINIESNSYVGVKPFGVVYDKADSGSKMIPICHQMTDNYNDGAFDNHIITTAVNARFVVTKTVDYVTGEFENYMTIEIQPYRKSFTIEKPYDSGEPVGWDVFGVRNIEFDDFIIRAESIGFDDDNTIMQLIINCDNNIYQIKQVYDGEPSIVNAVPSMFYDMIYKANATEYAVIKTDKGSFLYEGKENLDLTNDVLKVEELPFIGVENKLYALDSNTYDEPLFKPVITTDNGEEDIEINATRDVVDLARYGLSQEVDDYLNPFISANYFRFKTSDDQGGSFYVNQNALAIVRLNVGFDNEWNMKTAPSFAVSLENDPDNNNEPSYKIAWNFSWDGNDYNDVIYLPMAIGEETSFVGSDYDIGELDGDITFETQDNGNGCLDLFIGDGGNSVVILNGEYIYKDDFVEEVSTNEITLWKFKGGKYYQVSGGDDMVCGTKTNEKPIEEEEESPSSEL